MKKAYKFRIYPTKKQETLLEQWLRLCCELYNAALQERRDAYKLAGKSISFVEQANQLPEIKVVREDFRSIHSQVLQDVLKRLDKAFDNFFRRIKEGGKEPGYPRFKSKDRYDSFTYPQKGWRIEGDKLHLSKIGSVRMRLSRPIEGKIKTVAIKREVDQWFVIFSCETEEKALAVTGKAIGIDVGLEHFYTDHTGKTIDNPKHLRQSEMKLGKLSRKLSRKKKRSKNWNRAKKKVSKIHTKIKNQRRDFAHKLSRKLVNKNDFIFFEDLNIAGMVQNHHLAKSITDAGWAMFFHMLTYKAAEAGKTALNAAPHGTSQECSGCHKKVPKGLSVRWHKCPNCGLLLHRDHNAALNILARGIEILLAAGLAVAAPGGSAVVIRLMAGLLKGEPSHNASSSEFRRLVSASA